MFLVGFVRLDCFGLGYGARLDFFWGDISLLDLICFIDLDGFSGEIYLAELDWLPGLMLTLRREWLFYLVILMSLGFFCGVDWFNTIELVLDLGDFEILGGDWILLPFYAWDGVIELLPLRFLFFIGSFGPRVYWLFTSLFSG